MKKILTHWTLAFITLAVLMAWGLKDPFVKETARLKSFDLIQKYDTPTISEDVVIVEIDEKSIEQNGQWPWKWTVLADVIWRLREAGAGIIVLPILFSEEDRLGVDIALAESLVGNGVVIAQGGTTQTNKNAVPRGVAKIGDPMPWLFEWPGMLGPIPLIGDNVDGVGVLNTAPEIDGVVRRLPLLMRVGDEVYPSMAIEIIRVATGDPSYQVKTEQGGITKMRVPQYATIQTDPNGQIWLRWNKEFESISLAEDDYTPLAGKTVIIGITAEGLGNIIATPNGEVYAHMLPATALQNIINGDTITRYDFATFAEWAAAVILGLLLILASTRAPYYIGGALILIATISPVYGAYIAFTKHLLLVDWSWPVLVSGIVGFHAIFNRFTKEFFEKQAIKKQFAGYASPTVVRMLQENPKLIKDGMKKDISICFSDLRGFTPLGESFGDDVRGLTKIMNGYMDSITQPILDSDGMVIKYIGDASMHVHNAPTDDPNHPDTAVDTGLRMLKAVEKFNEDFVVPQGRPPVGMGAGINTGLGYLGEMGSTKRHSYDVLGDAVSTAARIESKCKEYGCLLLVGEDTYEQTKDMFFYLKVDDLQVKGKSVGLGIYTVLGDTKSHYNKAKIRHEGMHKLYREQKFDEAIEECKYLTKQFEGRMSKYYDMWIERCEYMKTQKLPKDWNGIFIATSK